MYSVLGNHKTMTHQYTVNVIHVYKGLIVFTQHLLTSLESLPYSGTIWSDVFTSVGGDSVSAFGCSGTLSADVDCSLMTTPVSVSSETP